MPTGRSNELMVAGVLLAAGGGRRYGMPKALAEYGDQLLVERGLATLQTAGCDPVVIVLGAAAEEVQERADLTGGPDGDGGVVAVVVNDDWTTGMGSSLRCAITTLAGSRADAAVILLVDTPSVTPAAVRRVAAVTGTHTARASTALVTATYSGRRGHPVLLGRSHWAAVAAQATGDVGARPYLHEHADQLVEIPCDDISDDTDLDFPTDTTA